MKYKYLLILIFSLSLISIAKEKPKLLWFDATANWERLSNKDSIVYYLDKSKQIGITDVVVDIKPITGEVLYKSTIAPQMIEWQNVKRDSNFDFLGFFIKEAHKKGLKVHASLNTFVGGHNFINRGIVYNQHPEWQCINYTDSGMVKITLLKHKYSAMLNPALKQVQDYELSILEEVIAKYKKLDGVILDRVRYDCLEADFSPASKELFLKYSGLKDIKFPEDIFYYQKDSSGKSKVIEGKYFPKWLEWRTSIIYNYIKRARTEIKKINKNISFGDYTGAWYPTYYEVGVNWASNKYDPSKEYKWATANYKNFGYAEQLDLFTTGNYFYEVTKDELINVTDSSKAKGEAGMHPSKEYWYSVEGSAELVNSVLVNSHPVYAGLYVDQYNNNSEQFKKAIQMCIKKSNGLMIFDIVHIINKNWWNVLKEGINTPLK